MAEVKNAFIKSKMNKDLDDRLIPSGEYRHAQNAQVSKSEGSDVGALQNILGNIKIADLTQEIPNVSSIGYFADDSSGTVYVFLTDNDNSSEAYLSDSNNFIFKYEIGSDTLVKLVEGSFLNFHKSYPIYGVNLLEDLLFWTDNRNQPRKINVSKDLGYYTTEDHVSVAKYFPYNSASVEKDSEIDVGEKESTMKDVVSKSLPNGGGANSLAVSNLQTFPITDLNIINYPNEPVNGFTIGYVDSFGEIIKLPTTVDSYTDPNITLQDTVTIPLIGDSTELVFNINPYYNNEYSGDESYLEDKFARFSYRFKFDDGEYSLIAPFTQVCFIPKQDGYFLNTSENIGDQQQAFESTIVDFMENKVNNIDLQIPLPCPADDLLPAFHITGIEILYKESDGLALEVVESIPVSSVSGASTVYEYSYASQKPYKTLPSNEITRVYDKVPVKALAQEVISNRVVYGNFLDKKNPPSFLDYNVAATEKTNVVEYPSSSLKTNRNYQVGVVLADRFGRQTTVVLSNNKDLITINGITYSGATLYSPYIDRGVDEDAWLGNSLKMLFNSIIPTTYNYSTSNQAYDPLGWYSYKIVVKQTEQNYYNVYTAGSLKGSPSADSQDSVSYISLINDNINKIPRDLSEVGPTQKQFRSSVKLFGRVENNLIAYSNIGNKQYYPGKKSFTTSTIQNLFDLFDFKSASTIDDQDDIYVMYNSESNPLVGQITTSQSSNGQFGTVNVSSPGYLAIENLTIFETEPETSRLEIYWETSTSGLISELNAAISEGGNSASGFSSFDTNTFTEGIAENENILDADFYMVDFFGATIDPNLVNSLTLNSVVTNQSTPNDVTNYFELYEPNPIAEPNVYNIKATDDFVNSTTTFYGADNSVRVFDFKFTAVVDNVSSVININNQAMANLNPVITATQGTDLDRLYSDTLITTLTAVNGANSQNVSRGKELTWTIVSQTAAENGSDNYFTLNQSSTDILSTCQVLNNQVNSLPFDTFTVVIRVTDGGGATDEVTLDINTKTDVFSISEYEFELEIVEGDGPETFYFVVLNITEPTGGFSAGYYAWVEIYPSSPVGGGELGRWTDLKNYYNNLILIDATNAATGSNCPSPGTPAVGGGWLYSSSLTDVREQAANCACGESFTGSLGSTIQSGNDVSFTMV